MIRVAALLWASAHASDELAVEDISLDDLLGVVEAPSRYEEPVSRSSAAVTVFRREQIERLGFSSIRELLRYVVGVSIIGHSADSQSISMRDEPAVTSPGLVVFLDGHQISSEFDGQTMWSSLPITLSDVDRVEIVRGPVSDAYGANAASGAINIVRASTTDGEARLDLGGGNLGTTHVGARFGVASRTTDYTLSAHQDTTQWLSSTGTSSSHVGFDAGASWVPAPPHRVGLYVGASAGPQQMLTPAFPDPFRTDTSSVFQSLDYEASTDHDRPLRVHLRQGLHAQVLDPNEATDLTDSLAALRYFKGDLDLAAHRSLLGPDQVTLGASLRFIDIDSEAIDRSIGVVPYYAAYVRERVELGPVTVNGGLRADANAFVPAGRLSWRLGSTWLFAKDQVLRATTGTAFRHPSFVEAVGELRDPTSGLLYVGGIGTDELAPPGLWSVEVGWRGRVAPGTVASASGYRNHVQDPIAQDHVAIPARYANTADYTVTAAECEVQVNPGHRLLLFMGGDHWTLRGEDVARDGWTALGGGAVEWIPGLSTEARARAMEGLDYATLMGTPANLLNTSVPTTTHIGGGVRVHPVGQRWSAAVRAQVALGGLDGRESPYPGAGTYEPLVVGQFTWRD